MSPKSEFSLAEKAGKSSMPLIKKGGTLDWRCSFSVVVVGELENTWEFSEYSFRASNLFVKGVDVKF